jgi:hypothetical protein
VYVEKRYRLLVRIVVNRRGLGVACIYFAWRRDVVKKKKDTGYYVCC